MNPPGPITGETARQAAQAELRRAEYHRDDPSILSRVLNWLGDRLDSVVSGTPSGSAILILLVLLAAVATFAIVRAGRPRRLAALRPGGSDLLAVDHRVDHRQVAAELERRGDFAQALREWLRAAVATIEARGALDPLPGRTGAGLARAAGAVMPTVAADFDRAAAAFDQVWFGQRPATAADAAIAHQVADSVQSARIDDAALVP